MPEKRLSRPEVVAIFTLSQGDSIAPAMADKLVKRGRATQEGGHVRLNDEGRRAFQRWAGVALP